MEWFGSFCFYLRALLLPSLPPLILPHPKLELGGWESNSRCSWSCSKLPVLNGRPVLHASQKGKLIFPGLLRNTSSPSQTCFPYLRSYAGTCKQARFHVRLRAGVRLDPAGDCEDCGSLNDSCMRGEAQVSILGRTERFLAFFPQELHAILCHVVLPTVYCFWLFWWVCIS